MAKSKFSRGNLFPQDAIIDSTIYSQRLVEMCLKQGMEVREKTRVVDEVEIFKDTILKFFGYPYSTEANSIKVILENQEIIYASKVLIATGGLYLIKLSLELLDPPTHIFQQ